MKLSGLFLLALMVMLSVTVKGQMDCRSMLGAHLTPIKKGSNISWGIEGTMAPGIMTSPYDSLDKTSLNGGMILSAVDFSFKEQKHHLYFEGGYKNWKNSNFIDSSNVLQSKHFGMRQAFYSFNGEKLQLKIGLHETRLGDFFLVDERIMGASVDKEIGAFTLNARVGSVNQSFARMGKFCANRHLYSLVNNGFTDGIGESMGETNLAGLVINWKLSAGKKVESDDEESGDEFSDSDDEFSDNNDEFHENHDFNEFGDDEFAEENTDGYKFKMSNLALVLYDEFGAEEYIPDNKLYTGLLADFVLPMGIYLQTGAVYQNMKNNNTVVYIAKFAKSQSWNNASLTKISGAYIGKVNIDDNAVFQPLFSNLFLGEIMRLDASDFPLWQVAVKHRFPGKLKFHIALKSVGQITDDKTNEQDLEFGMMLFKKHLKITAIASHVNTNLLPNDFFMGRLELRLAF